MGYYRKTVSTRMKNHRLSDADLDRRIAVCSTCGPVKIYISRTSVICKNQAIEIKNSRFNENIGIINEHKRRQTCKRCGYWSQKPKDFKFFEMHLPKRLRISTLAYSTTPERLKFELNRRDMFCKKCYPLIRREVTDNIAAPPVKPFSTLF